MEFYFVFINAQDSSDNLIGQNVITWGCINGWYRLVSEQRVSEQRVCASCSPAVLCNARCRFQPIRVTKIGITRLSQVFWKCFVCPQKVNFSLALFNFFFLHFENEIVMGIYKWE